MIAVIQRVTSASVEIKGETKSRVSIGGGYLVLVAVKKGDSCKDTEYLSGKIINLRLFPDDKGRMHFSIKDTGGELLVIPQFTLLGDVSGGLRPDFTQSELPQTAENMFNELCEKLTAAYKPVRKGFFGKHMTVDITNDGPVTIIIDSRK